MKISTVDKRPIEFREYRRNCWPTVQTMNARIIEHLIYSKYLIYSTNRRGKGCQRSTLTITSISRRYLLRIYIWRDAPLKNYFIWDKLFGNCNYITPHAPTDHDPDISASTTPLQIRRIHHRKMAVRVNIEKTMRTHSMNFRVFPSRMPRKSLLTIFVIIPISLPIFFQISFSLPKFGQLSPRRSFSLQNLNRKRTQLKLPNSWISLFFINFQRLPL
jgi:hypothetical protein